MVLKLKGKRPIQKTNGNSKKNKEIAKQIKRIRKNWDFSDHKIGQKSRNRICLWREEVCSSCDCGKKICYVYELFITCGESKLLIFDWFSNKKENKQKQKIFVKRKYKKRKKTKNK